MSASRGIMMWKGTFSHLSIVDKGDVVSRAASWLAVLDKHGDKLMPRVYPCPNGAYVMVRQAQRPAAKGHRWDVYRLVMPEGIETARVIWQRECDTQGDAAAACRAGMRAEWPEGQSPKWARREGM